MVFTKTVTLTSNGPFSLDLSAQMFATGDEQVRRYLNGEFSQVIKANNELILVKVKSEGTAEKPKVNVELHSANNITPKNTDAAQKMIEYIFNLNSDLTSFYKQVENDEVMKKIVTQLYGYKYPTAPTVFEALVDSIIEQQISIKVARGIEERVTKRFGDKLELDNETYFVFPTAQNIKEASISDIRGCGLSQRKAEYIYGVAELVTEGKLDLEELKNEDRSEEIIRELDAIKGIGVWTAELTMLRGMQRLEALPAEDLGIRRVISKYYCGGEAIKAAEAREVAEAWGDWKGLAAFYLICAEANNIEV